MGSPVEGALLHLAKPGLSALGQRVMAELPSFLTQSSYQHPHKHVAGKHHEARLRTDMYTDKSRYSSSMYIYIYACISVFIRTLHRLLVAWQLLQHL